MNEKLTVGSCFSGIGGLELGLEWTGGFETKWQIEIDPYATKVLEKHWPNVQRFSDITTVTNPPRVDVICGGFPCPAFSRAGKRGGLEQDGLFYELKRIIREANPRWIIIENVEGILRWRDEIISEIKSIGFELDDGILDARDFGIPQSRRRWFAIGLSRRSVLRSQHIWGVQRKKGSDIQPLLSNNQNPERWWTPTINSDEEWREIFSHSTPSGNPNGFPSRSHRLRCLGNAVVPQVAQKIGEMILNYEKQI